MARGSHTNLFSSPGPIFSICTVDENNFDAEKPDGVRWFRGYSRSNIAKLLLGSEVLTANIAQ
jgi:hypothetical protein